MSGSALTATVGRAQAASGPTAEGRRHNVAPSPWCGAKTTTVQPAPPACSATGTSCTDLGFRAIARDGHGTSRRSPSPKIVSTSRDVTNCGICGRPAGETWRQDRRRHHAGWLSSPFGPRSGVSTAVASGRLVDDATGGFLRQEGSIDDEPRTRTTSTMAARDGHGGCGGGHRWLSPSPPRAPVPQPRPPTRTRRHALTGSTTRRRSWSTASDRATCGPIWSSSSRSRTPIRRRRASVPQFGGARLQGLGRLRGRRHEGSGLHGDVAGVQVRLLQLGRGPCDAGGFADSVLVRARRISPLGSPGRRPGSCNPRAARSCRRRRPRARPAAARPPTSPGSPRAISP